jgi:hypothetical protein
MQSSLKRYSRLLSSFHADIFHDLVLILVGFITNLRRTMPMRRLKLLVALISVLVSFSLISAGCSGTSGQQSSDPIHLAPMTDMPANVRAAPVNVQEAYRFAAVNPDTLTHIPCYCGCGAIGHTSNYACYVSGKKDDGSLAFDEHALGCSICVDITQDSMRLLKQGKSTAEIRAYVDQTYSQYGPSNMP